MSNSRQKIRKWLCILIVILWTLNGGLSCGFNYLNFYAGYPIKNLELEGLSNALNRYLSELLYSDIERTFTTKVVDCAETLNGAAVLFTDHRQNDFCGLAELEYGPFGRYRIVRIEAGETAGTVRALSSWKSESGFIYSLKCTPGAESYALSPGGVQRYQIPQKRTFIEQAAFTAPGTKVLLLDKNGDVITEPRLGKEGMALPTRECAIGNPDFFVKTSVARLLSNTVWCIVMVVAVLHRTRSWANSTVSSEKEPSIQKDM